MVRKILLISVLIFFSHCIPYIQGKVETRLVRIAIINGTDSVSISGIRDNIFYESYPIKEDADLPIFFNPKDGKVLVNKKSYRGGIEIKRINGKIWVINILDIEDYLKGVVPCEIGKLSKNLIEAAKAQAVAARTYAYSHLHQYEELGFDLYATTKDQVYQGIQIEDSLINKAIMETRGLVLTYKGKPIDAKYHSTCGGWTADFSDIWRDTAVPYLRSVKCGFCNESPHFYWQKKINKQEFFKNLRKNLSRLGILLDDREFIKELKFKRNPHNRRVINLKIITNKNEYNISGYNIRLVFGFEKDPDGLLKSNNFSLNVQKDSIIIEGKGFGHGVGMCQFGAIGMAKKGKKYKEILKHYYPGTKLVIFR